MQPGSATILYTDHGGVIRGKACTRQFLAERIDSGIGHSVAMMAMSMLDTLPAVDGKPEFTLGRRIADPETGLDRLEPLDDSLVYSATGSHTAHDYVIDLVAALRVQDMQVEHYYPELGHGTAAPRGRGGGTPGRDVWALRVHSLSHSELLDQMIVSGPSRSPV